jgi:hypothetical protein
MNPARGVRWSKRTGGGRDGSGAVAAPVAASAAVERAAGAELDAGMPFPVVAEPF